MQQQQKEKSIKSSSIFSFLNLCWRESLTIFWTDTERETGCASCPLRQATEDDNLSWRACTATWPSSISSWQTPSRDGGSGPTLQSNINRDKAGIYTEYMIGNKYIYKYTLYTQLLMSYLSLPGTHLILFWFRGCSDSLGVFQYLNQARPWLGI